MAEREIIHVLKKSDIVNRPLPSSLKYGEPIVNTADGIMYFSGVTTSTNEWTAAGTGTTANFFEVGSNLYDLKLRNQLIEYQGVSGGGLSGKFLSGTTNGFVLADISDISEKTTASNGLTEVGNDIQLGGALSQSTVISGGTNNLQFGTGNSQINQFRVNAIESIGEFTAPGAGVLNVNQNPGGFTSLFTDATTQSRIQHTSGEAYVRVYKDSGAQRTDFILSGAYAQLMIQSPDTNNQQSGFVMNANTGQTLQFVFVDTRTTTKGLEYYADYSTGFTNNSLITKKYVDDAITGVSASDTFVTGFTYDDANNLTISRNEGEADLTVNLSTFTGVTISTLDSNAIVYTNGSGALTTESTFTYNEGNDTMTVGNIIVQNGTGTTATFGQGGVTIGSGGIGNLTVQGDLTVLGDTTTVSTSELLIEDPTITVNYSTGTTNPTSLGSGIEIQDGDGAGTDLYLKVEELNTAYSSEYPSTTGAANRAFYTSLNDIVIRQATDTSSPTIGQVGKRVLAEDDILDGGTY